MIIALPKKNLHRQEAAITSCNLNREGLIDITLSHVTRSLVRQKKNFDIGEIDNLPFTPLKFKTMPSTTGKRKRDTAVVSRSTKTKEASPPPIDNAQDIFRKYFEAQFEPIEPPKPDADPEEDEDEIDEEELSDAEGSDWDGISGEEEEDSDEESYEVEIVEHKDAKRDDLMDKKARKAFMVRVVVVLVRGDIVNTMLEFETTVIGRCANKDSRTGYKGRGRRRQGQLQARSRITTTASGISSP